ncbi:DUF3105 domain-containing protein [Kitasatospora sp. NBC_01250]|uniref:DUF3105 domain-containing protein n=1 Tax=unclassified Kitasatospora TaxID=2633591 RepID=UPI002E0E683E|nr:MULTISPECIES: DUF3105 domain-containing protein [unclassified Kitasatospora]WSJ70044.1 DUF3105 domain-containing protein [Kitasatospora sp. NBC_01302]
MGSASKQTNNGPGGKNAGAAKSDEPLVTNRSAKAKGGKQADRRERIAQLRAEEQRREKRMKVIAFSVAGVLIAATVGVGGYIVVDANKKHDKEVAAAKAPIPGVQTWTGLTRNHVQGTVNYPQTPPVGGDHNPVWLTCMGNVYDKPVQNENAVHSLEHGAVWVTYNDKATADDIKTLSDKVKVTPYSMMSPYPTEKGTITLSAWGTQLVLDSAKDPRVNEFFTKYVQGPQTQEPGASCSDGAM